MHLAPGVSGPSSAGLFRAQETENGHLASLCQKHLKVNTFYKGFLTGNRRPTFSIILGGPSVRTVCRAGGQRERDFLPSGQTVQDFLCLGRTVQDFFALRKPKMGTWPVRVRNSSKSTLYKRHFNRNLQANIFKNSRCAALFALRKQNMCTGPVWVNICLKEF